MELTDAFYFEHYAKVPINYFGLGSPVHVHVCFAMQHKRVFSFKTLCPLAKLCDGQSLPPSILCDFIKYPYPPQEGSLDSFRGEDGQKSQILNRKYEGRLQHAIALG